MALDSDKLAYFKSIGPANVIREIAEGKHGQASDSRLRIEALTWVDSETLRMSLASEVKRDAREERTLAIASSALWNSRLANVIAITAAIFAAAAAIIGVICEPPK